MSASPNSNRKDGAIFDVEVVRDADTIDVTQFSMAGIRKIAGHKATYVTFKTNDPVLVEHFEDASRSCALSVFEFEEGGVLFRVEGIVRSTWWEAHQVGVVCKVEIQTNKEIEIL